MVVVLIEVNFIGLWFDPDYISGHCSKGTTINQIEKKNSFGGMAKKKNIMNRGCPKKKITNKGCPKKKKK